MGDQKQEISDILGEREMKETDASGALSSPLRAEGELIGHQATQDFFALGSMQRQEVYKFK